MNELKRIFKKISKKNLFLIIILTIITTLISVIIPYIIGYIIDNIKKEIIGILLLLLILCIIKFIINLITNYVIINITENTIYNLRKEAFNKLEELPLNYFDKNDKGNIMSIITNDIQNINECLTELITTITGSIITFIGVTIMMFYMNVLLSIIIILTVPLFFIIVSKMSNKMNEYFNLKQQLLGELTTNTEEIVSSVKTIKELNKEEYFIDKFNKENNKFKNISIKASIYSYLLLPINLIINNLSNILVIGVGSLLVIKGNLKIGNIVSFLSYASMFKEPINDLSSMIGMISDGIASSKRLYGIIDYKKENKNGINIDIKGNIEFKNVSFKYDDKYILKDISFNIEPNTTLSIVGETGSGKTTITNLLEKFYSINKGNILIDEYNIDNINSICLRNNIGLVLQDTKLFKGTIMDNLKYGISIDDKEVIKICKKMGADIFIERLLNSYYTEIDNDTNMLSSGEKQLISIIRCIIKNPKIIILDEATSDVDIKTEKLIYNGIRELLKNRTSIVIAHRLSTIKNSDKIILIDDGKIKENGSHKELIDKKGSYYDMFMKQIS